MGGLPSDIKMSELKEDFGKYGKIFYISIKQRFAFIEYEDYHAANDAIRNLNGQKLYDNEIVTVENAKGGERARNNRRDDRDLPGERRAPRGFSPNDKCFNC